MSRREGPGADTPEMALLSDRLVEFYERLSAWEQSVAQDSGLSLPHLHLLEVLGIRGPMRMRDLSAQLGVTTGTLTVSIDKLEQAACVHRVPNPHDRRSWVIELSPRGQELHRQHSAYHMDLVREATHDFSPEEIRILASWLERLMEHF